MLEESLVETWVVSWVSMLVDSSVEWLEHPWEDLSVYRLVETWVSGWVDRSVVLWGSALGG